MSGVEVGAKRYPTVLVICATVVALGVLGSITYLLTVGQLTVADVIQLATTLAAVATGAGGLVYGRQAAARASVAVEQTNGSLDRRMEEATRHAVANAIADCRLASEDPEADPLPPVLPGL